jgi:hypothetical protein
LLSDKLPGRTGDTSQSLFGNSEFLPASHHTAAMIGMRTYYAINPLRHQLVIINVFEARTKSQYYGNYGTPYLNKRLFFQAFQCRGESISSEYCI